ncbi:Tetratricopeptide repeat-containing protein [Treponema sp. JC4]|uniref:tetratricopeptide repeat protein n=1 Tax=Treponema sp. JC4 TaxID=1124982 RepID=UPI00025B06DC|nr:tetratricopeptide repeat protein [Treponema sp. JC4]EID86398.1 Tetratricopeptide repeat-containing protein [Treponema sp. JC4]
MNPSNPLESVFYISIPENFVASDEAFKIDTKIQLPVQKKPDEAPGSFNPSEITTEQILAGILTLLAYDKKNEHLDYYRSIIKKVKPNIKKELCEAAILKTKNEDFDLAEEIFLALNGLDPEDPAIILNLALFLDQRADSYRNSGLNDDADAYDNDAGEYYANAMNAEPPLPDAFFNAGFYYMKQHKYREAKDAFETYLALTCDIKDEDLGENGIYKKERAQEILDNIKNQNMDDEAFRAAYDFISKGQEEKGLEEIRRFLQNNPKVWNAWFMLGWGLRRLERYSDARMAFLEALKCGGDSNSDTYNELSLCYVQEKDFDAAKDALFKAMAIEPESTKIISNLGYLALAQGNKEEARKYFSTVLEYDSNDRIAAAELLKLEQE